MTAGSHSGRLDPIYNRTALLGSGVRIPSPPPNRESALPSAGTTRQGHNPTDTVDASTGHPSSLCFPWCLKSRKGLHHGSKTAQSRQYR